MMLWLFLIQEFFNHLYGLTNPIDKSSSSSGINNNNTGLSLLLKGYEDFCLQLPEDNEWIVAEEEEDDDDSEDGGEEYIY